MLYRSGMISTIEYRIYTLYHNCRNLVFLILLYYDNNKYLNCIICLY
jgi:hypothetical protein